MSLQPGAHCGVQIDVKLLSSCLNSPSVYTATSGDCLFNSPFPVSVHAHMCADTQAYVCMYVPMYVYVCMKFETGIHAVI